jgi:hypothetical protein
MDGGKLMSGTSIDALALPPSMRLERMDGPCGVTVRGVDLAEYLPGDVVGGLLAVANHAGLVHLPDQRRLDPKPKRQDSSTVIAPKAPFRAGQKSCRSCSSPAR